MQFRGRNIFDDMGYPSVYLPEHPRARQNGCMRIHRVIAEEIYGEIPEGYHVHHLDEDKWNWSPDNLVVVSNSDHGKYHKPIREEVICESCNQTFMAKPSESRKYCSIGCSAKGQEKVRWPDVEILRQWVKDTSYVAVGRKLGVSDNAVRKRLRGRDVNG